MTEKCETCKYFSSMTTTCRRNAPVIAIDPQWGFKSEGRHTYWPEVNYNSWCGEYQAIANES